MSKEIFIHKDIASTTGANEATEVRMTTCIKDGTSELVISHKITERYPVPEYEKVMALKERLTRGGGRRLVSLEEIAKGWIDQD